MSDEYQRRYRFVKWPVPHPPNFELCTTIGAEELGVPTQPDDDLVLLYPPETDPGLVASFAWALWRQGHTVVLEEEDGQTHIGREAGGDQASGEGV